jgi:hypothetical protein
MATTDFTVGDILDLTASLMNDTAKSKYTYTAMLPYFNMALAMMQEHLEVNEIPVSEETSAAVSVTTGVTTVVAGTTSTNYPDDLIEIQQLWERLEGSSDPYVPMVKRNYLPHYLDDIETSDLVYWTWLSQEIQFIGATTDREVKIDYIKQVFANTVTSTSTAIYVMNSRTFLEFKTAALCARYIGENPTRADSLDIEAEMAKDRLISINVKGAQDVQVRRKPFMTGYKTRGTI